MGVAPDGKAIGDRFHYYVTPTQLAMIGASFVPFLMVPFVIAYVYKATNLQPFEGRRPVDWANQAEATAIYVFLATVVILFASGAAHQFVRRRIWDQIIDPDTDAWP